APVPYTAQFWPFPFAGWGGLNGAKWNVSVASGVQSLNNQIDAANTADPGGDIVIFGYSQGATVSNIVKRQLADANGGVIPDQYSFVFIGDPQRPNGGLFERLAWLGTVPVLDATFGQPAPTDTTVLPAVNTTDIAFQYDGVADFPANPLNLLADLNALAGFWYVHGTYLAPKGNDPSTALPYGYTIPELEAAMNCSQSPKNCQTYNDTLYITIPAKTLPIMQPLLDIGAATGTTAIIKPFVDLISPVTRVLIETGYDRSNYGQPTPFTGVAVPAAPSAPTSTPVSSLSAATTSESTTQKAATETVSKPVQRKASPKPSLTAKSEKPKTGDEVKSSGKPAKSGTGKSGKPAAASASAQGDAAKAAA
ncbi:MAG: PE-PPE domain-containing protein, partial [Mycolicibacterium aromaticivorans]|nr:PE-PPE domain-containing protein [Mycolicibacterium aromaticivorans]